MSSRDNLSYSLCHSIARPAKLNSNVLNDFFFNRHILADEKKFPDEVIANCISHMFQACISYTYINGHMPDAAQSI